MKKQLYPIKFIPIPSKRVWGGSALIKRFDKQFVETDQDGNEVPLTADDLIGESWELADMGFADSVVSEGWLAGNSIGELMETYLDKIVGENVYNYYGRQFPLLVKFLDIHGKLSVQVHPDDEVAAERYDQLGKLELWHVIDVEPGAKIYAGFNREISAQEMYDRCLDGTVEEVLNVIYPKKGDTLLLPPGTVHAATGGLLIAEIEESSDMTFRLYDWGREFNPETARPMHLEEAIDLIDYRQFDNSLYRKGPLWGDEASDSPCGHSGEHHDEHHDGKQVVETLVESPQFNVTKINLTDPLHIYTEKFESFIVYVCLEGEASIQCKSQDGKSTDSYFIKAGETVLVPAEHPDFLLVPIDRSTVLLEAVTRPEELVDEYIDPTTEPFLEGENYEGLELED